MAIAQTDKDYVYATSTTATSQAFDAGTGSDRVVLGWITCPNGETCSGAVIGGAEALTELATDNDGSGNYGRRYLFGKLNPTAAGSQTITFTLTGSGVKYGLVASYGGVGSLGAAITGSNTSQGTTAGPTLPLTASNLDVVVLLGHDNERSTTVSSWGSPAVGFTVAGAGGTFGAEEVSSGGTTTVDGTFSAGGAWGAGAVVLVPAGGGGGGGSVVPIFTQSRHRR